MSSKPQRYDPFTPSGVKPGTKLYEVTCWMKPEQKAGEVKGTLEVHTIVRESLGHDGRTYFWEVTDDSRPGQVYRVSRNGGFFTPGEAYQDYLSTLERCERETHNRIADDLDLLKHCLDERKRFNELLKPTQKPADEMPVQLIQFGNLIKHNWVGGKYGIVRCNRCGENPGTCEFDRTGPARFCTPRKTNHAWTLSGDDNAPVNWVCVRCHKRSSNYYPFPSDDSPCTGDSI